MVAAFGFLMITIYKKESNQNLVSAYEHSQKACIGFPYFLNTMLSFVMVPRYLIYAIKTSASVG